MGKIETHESDTWKWELKLYFYLSAGKKDRGDLAAPQCGSIYQKREVERASSRVHTSGGVFARPT